MEILTPKLKKEIIEYLKSQSSEYMNFSQEFKECKEILKESLGKQISEMDSDILTRLIQDNDKLIDKIDKITKEDRGNIFD